MSLGPRPTSWHRLKSALQPYGGGIFLPGFRICKPASLICLFSRGTPSSSTLFTSTISARNCLAKSSMRVISSAVGDLAKQLRSEEHTSELQSHLNIVCRLLLEKKK